MCVERTTSTRDVALGLVVTGARVGAAAGRLVLLPVRVAARTPVVSTALRRAGEELSADGEKARERGRRRLEDAADELLAAPEVERTIDNAMAGPLTEAVARSAAEHRVAERLAAEIVATPEFEEAVAAALDHEATRRLVDRALDSPGLERLVADAIESRLAGAVIDRVASSPEVRTALARQTTSLADEMVVGVRRRAGAADDSAERRARRWLRRPQRSATDYRSGLPPYAGVATRAAALALDLLLALVVAVTLGATLALIASLVGELRPAWLVGALTAVWWLLVSGSYFVLFWATAGQTPAMRLMHVQVLDRRGEPPGLLRSIVRFCGLLLAIVPLFAGFLPVLFDERRRGLPDYLAGTVVRDLDRLPARAELDEAYEPAPTG